MIASGDDQLCVRQSGHYELECLNHEFKAFIGSPFAESQDAVFRIAAACKIRIFRSSRQNAVRTDVNIVVAILFVEDLPVPGHEHRYRVRQKNHSGGNRAGCPVNARVLHARILQIDGIH